MADLRKRQGAYPADFTPSLSDAHRSAISDSLVPSFLGRDQHSLVKAMDLTVDAAQAHIEEALAETTGASHIGFAQPGTGGVLRTLQEKAEEIVSVKDFGAVGDGVTDDTNAIQAALNYANAIGGATIVFPAGVYFTANSSPTLRVRGNVRMVGAGMDVSVLRRNDSAQTSRSDMFVSTDADPAGNVVIEDLGFEADWGDGGDFTQRSQLIELAVTGRFSANRCRFAKSRYMALVVRNATHASVTNCVFHRTVADGCRITASDNVTVANNFFDSINDDAIAIHAVDAEASPVQGGVVVTGNRIVDSQGIAVLGAKQATISNNVLNRCIVRGIFVGTVATATTEGNTAVLGVTISNNVITDMFRGTTFFASSGAGANYIMVSGIAPTTNGSGYVGQRDGAGGVVSPFPYFYTNNTDAAPPAAGNWFINITGNICVRTLTPTAAYSNYGFGTRYGRGGPVDPAISAVQLGSDAAQVLVSNHAQGLIIQGNQLWGGGYGVYLDGTSGSAYLSFRDTMVSNNKIGHFDRNGVFVEGPGVVEVKGNLFDGDPLHVHAQRLANGKWTNGTTHSAVRWDGCNLIVHNNTIRNVQSLFTGASTDDCSWLDNAICADPNTNNGYNADNIGVGFFGALPRYGARMVIEDGDPASATFGKIKNVCVTASNSLPTTGKYLTGTFVQNALPAVAGGAGSQYVVQGWVRLTNGSAHVLNTDWREMRCLTGT